MHGAGVTRVTAELAGAGVKSPAEILGDSDAVLLAEPGVFALALSADCPLIAIADPRARRAGIAHAGWRGTAAGVIEALVEGFRREGSSSEDLHASISPGVCGECYPVGEEVFAALAGRPGAAQARRGDSLDLRVIHRAVLEAQGVRTEAISVSADCSACGSDRFFSYRRDGGKTGRNGALVGWRP